MKRIAIIIVGAASLPTGFAAEPVPRRHDEYDQGKWPNVNLKLSQAATLKDIFDSGLLPYRHPGLEKSLLEVKHLNLQVIFGSGRALPMLPLELVNITVFRDGELATIEGFTPKLTLDQARSKMVKWLPYGDNQRTEKELDDFLAEVDSDFLDFDDPFHGSSHGCSVSWKEPGWKTRGGGPQVVVWFRKSSDAKRPLRLYFKAAWSANRPHKDRRTHHLRPIEPPPGYHDVDMKAPDKFGPDSEVDIFRAGGVDIGEMPKTANIVENQPNEKKPGELTSEKEEYRTIISETKLKNHYWWIAIGIVVAAAFAVMRRLK